MIRDARALVDRINAARENKSPDLAIPTGAKSQFVTNLNQMIQEQDSANRLAQEQAKYDAREQVLNERLNSGLGLNTEALGLNDLNTAGSGVRNQINNVKLDPNSPFTPSIKRMALSNPKYSQGRGKGCTDCSAATQKWYKDTTGKDIGDWTEAQWKNGISVDPSQAKSGQLVFFKDPSKTNRNVTHVGMYNGDGTFTHMSTSGMKTSPLKGYSLPIVGFKRYI